MTLMGNLQSSTSPCASYLSPPHILQSALVSIWPLVSIYKPWASEVRGLSFEILQIAYESP